MNLYDFTRPQLCELLARWGGRPVHAARLWRYLYREATESFDRMVELPPRLREQLSRETSISPLAVAGETRSEDGLTHKYLLALADGQSIETVLMRMPGRATACLSSQAGCALGCVFCATGQMGFGRNLSTGEIVAQALHVSRVLDGKLTNVVLMGMGEPLQNYEAVMAAAEILCDSAGLSIGGKQVTLSTVGVVPGIVRLADEARRCSLAVSLHAATQDERAALVPAARAWPLDALMEACRYYSDKLDRKIFFEWTLIADRNDSAEQAHTLARLVGGIPAQINLIPLNPTPGYEGAPGGSAAADRFRSILQEYGLPVSIRRRRGIEIAAGCGQLAAAEP